jgi:hypothetical protein
MKLNDEKYKKQLVKEMQDVVKEHSSFIDIGLYNWIAQNIRADTDETKQELYDVIRNSKPSGDHEMADSIRALHHAFCLFEAHGSPHWASKMLQIMAVLGSMNATADKYVEIKISEDKSNARKGKTNRHYEKAIEIAKNTWGEYPNASVSGLSDDIYKILSKTWTDVPASSTIYTWLNKSGFNPNIKIKNRNYKVILTKGM